MRLSIISILLVFISAVCAIPLGAIASNIRPISKRTVPMLGTIAQLILQLRHLAIGYSDLEMFWDHDLGAQIAGTEHIDPVHKLGDLYNGEPVIIKAIISDHITDEMVIHNVVYISKAGMKLRAFAKNNSPSPGSPRFLIVIADDGYRSTFRPNNLPHGVSSAEVSKLRKKAEENIDLWRLAFPTQHNDLLRPTGKSRNPWEIVFA
ncbi:hypothetical protein F5887DRAFT_965150 [Amanita rubescens]|nr:hypothetical protein F5887DRAFT_965150 [Amanita rubescens]